MFKTFDALILLYGILGFFLRFKTDKCSSSCVRWCETCQSFFARLQHANQRHEDALNYYIWSCICYTASVLLPILINLFWMWLNGYLKHLAFVLQIIQNLVTMVYSISEQLLGHVWMWLLIWLWISLRTSICWSIRDRTRENYIKWKLLSQLNKLYHLPSWFMKLKVVTRVKAVIPSILHCSSVALNASEHYSLIQVYW